MCIAQNFNYEASTYVDEDRDTHHDDMMKSIHFFLFHSLS